MDSEHTKMSKLVEKSFLVGFISGAITGLLIANASWILAFVLGYLSVSG